MAGIGPFHFGYIPPSDVLTPCIRTPFMTRIALASRSGQREEASEWFSCLAVTAPGLASLAAQELHALGVAPAVAGPEGVSFRASLTSLYAANLWLRTASRVIVRMASFPVETFYDLERRAARVPWARYLAPGVRVRLRVTCRKSRLYHSDAVADRIEVAVHRAGAVVISEAGGPSVTETGEESRRSDLREPDDRDRPSPPAIGGGGSRDLATADGEQLVVVRLFHDECTISIDASGALLHRRGYRQETGKAPLRETLAAALLMTSGWVGQGPLLDPLCGSGTVAIEAAWLTRRRAPGIDRAFAFMRWPAFDRAAWDRLVSEARSGERSASPVPIQASDRDEGAMAAAGRNAARAGVAGDIELTTRAISAIRPPSGPGWLVTNPPYGVRVGERDRLRNLYAQLGQVARTRCPDWTVALLSADPLLARQTGLALASRLRTTNGGIPVDILLGTSR